MKTSIGDRMKKYEDATDYVLVPRTPCIIRVDGKTFHTMTRRWVCARPFDTLLQSAMCQTAMYLCQNIQGAVIAYTQSDEISVGVVDYHTIDANAWFDRRVQKMASVAAAMATVSFNYCWGMTRDRLEWPLEKHALFDARVFTLPRDEVVNYFIWRQQDAVRNSVNMAAQSIFYHKRLRGKSSSELQEMLFEAGINWNDYPTISRRGACIVKRPVTVTSHDTTVERYRWHIDSEIPVFTADRGYIASVFETGGEHDVEARETVGATGHC